MKQTLDNIAKTNICIYYMIIVIHEINVYNVLLYRLLVPVSMIICNDIMAYMFGFFFGKTPLIKLSPKKTWEGFIGGAFSTVIFGLVVRNTACNLFHCT